MEVTGRQAWETSRTCLQKLAKWIRRGAKRKTGLRRINIRRRKILFEFVDSSGRSLDGYFSYISKMLSGWLEFTHNGACTSRCSVLS